MSTEKWVAPLNEIFRAAGYEGFVLKDDKGIVTYSASRDFSMPKNLIRYTTAAYVNAVQAGKSRKTAIGLAAAYLKENPPQKKVGDLRVPGVCNIIAMSRPLHKWAPVRHSIAVQKAVYAMTSRDAGRLARMSSDKLRAEKLRSLAQLDPYDGPGLDTYSQKVVKTAVNIYFGEEKKAINRAMREARRQIAEGYWRNYRETAKKMFASGEMTDVLRDKMLAKVRRQVDKALESIGDIDWKRRVKNLVYEDDGTMKNPPGINHVLGMVSTITIRPLRRDDDDILSAVPEIDYVVDPEKPLPDLRELLPGVMSSGKRRMLRSNHGRRGQRGEKQIGVPFYYILRAGKDWLVCDGRGLLRLIRHRHVDLRRSDLTPLDVLSHFSSGGSVDPRDNVVRMITKENSIPVIQRRSSGAAKAFAEVGKAKSTSIVVAVDVGHVNGATCTAMTYDGKQVAHGIMLPTAGRRMRLDPETSTSKFDGRIIKRWPRHEASDVPSGCDIIGGEDLERMYFSLYDAHDTLKKAILEQAVAMLSPKMRRSYDDHVTSATAAITKLMLDTVEKRAAGAAAHVSGMLDTMTGSGVDISQAIVSCGGEMPSITKNVRGTKKDKHGNIKTEVVQMSNWDWYKQMRDLHDPLPSLVRMRLNKNIYRLQDESPEYQSLKRAADTLRGRIANTIMAWASSLKLRFKISGECRVIIALEDMDLSKGRFQGRGYRKPGWYNFFAPKKEGRWFNFLGIQKTFVENATNKGWNVVLYPSYWTSLRCPNRQCHHIDYENRPERDVFKCVKCGYENHADIVGSMNGAIICITDGKKIIAPKGTARKRKTVEISVKNSIANPEKNVALTAA